MLIPIHFKYKNYPNAPITTGKSKALGLITAFIPMVVWSFLFCAIVGGILTGMGLDDDTAFLIGGILIIPFVFAVLKLKKRAIQKLDQQAAAEYMKMLTMTPEEMDQMEKQRKKKWIRFTIYIWAALILMFFVLILRERLA